MCLIANMLSVTASHNSITDFKSDEINWSGNTSYYNPLITKHLPSEYMETSIIVTGNYNI